MGTEQLARPTADPLDPLEVADLNLESIEGLRTYLGRALTKLAGLPFDVKTANAMGQLITAQRGILETTDLERRVADLESQLAGRNIRAA